jgi:hypothetical protein
MTEDKASPLLLALTTEHFTLQTARSATIAESNGRAILFLGTVSSSVVAIALVGQLSRFGAHFFAFALTLLPALVFLGIATYFRVLQNGLEDLHYARAINRIRKHYLGLDPTAPDLFVLSAGQRPSDAMHGAMNPRWQSLFTTAGMIAFVVSLLAGVTSALALGGGLGLPLVASTAVGVGCGLATELALYRHQRARWAALSRDATG